MTYQLSMERTPDSQAGISMVYAAPKMELQRAQTMREQPLHKPGYFPILDQVSPDSFYSGGIQLGKIVNFQSLRESSSEATPEEAIMAQIARVQFG